MQITMTRQALAEALNKQLAAAKAEDARLAKSHQADEAKALQDFRKRLREAMKWDYAKLKQKGFEVEISYSKRPSCPMRNEPRIATQIRMLQLDTRTGSFSVAKGSDLYDALIWKPEPKRETVCD